MMHEAALPWRSPREIEKPQFCGIFPGLMFFTKLKMADSKQVHLSIQSKNQHSSTTKVCQWFNGKISACQADAPGSIPG